ncbi:MAG: tail length tape measure protein, partial [Mastigocladus sp. ERB_26_1]
YLLGQDRDAWLQWQAEFHNKAQPTVAEQFTEGLMLLTQGENLLGIDKISKLEDREKPEEKAEYEALSKQITYWQARYPFPYLKEIEYWSRQRQLNPLLVTALIRQESRFQPKIKSVANATGLMQVLPDTAKWIAPQIKEDSKKINLEDPND